MKDYALGRLIEEKELLSNPAHWTKGDLARDENGVTIDPYSNKAICWCQAGAEMKIRANNWHNITVFTIKDIVARTMSHNSAVLFNDDPNTTHDDLMKFYDECIILAKNS